MYKIVEYTLGNIKFFAIKKRVLWFWWTPLVLRFQTGYGDISTVTRLFLSHEAAEQFLKDRKHSVE